MFKYEIFNIPEEIFINYNIVDSIFLYISELLLESQNGILNIIFENNDKIMELNNNYRGINKSTDVLSFHYYDDFSILNDSQIAGEVLLSFDKILIQKVEYNNTSEEEFYKLLVHSILHILGYDHESDEDYITMSKIEDEIIDKINNLYNISIS